MQKSKLRLTHKIHMELTIWICKALAVTGRVIFKRGTSAAGALALKLCPWILSELAGNVREKTIVVCGTNGKTTTNNLICTILEKQGKKVICNKNGANMLTGIVTAYINGCRIFGGIDADYACLEIDEATATKAFDSIKPDYMVITNFFRDQLDRYGEIDMTVDWIRKAVEKVPDTILVVNGDDPLCAALSRESDIKCCYYGIDEELATTVYETKESRFCPFCRKMLSYSYYQYSQLGDYSCKHCGFSRPALDHAAIGIKNEKYVSFMVDNHAISANLIGVHNIYNVLAAVSVALQIGINVESLCDALLEYKTKSGRMEEFVLSGMPVMLNLSKNPVGLNQAISDMLMDSRKKDVIIIINDNAPDGRDISWLWDVDFEDLADESFNSFTASGIRAEDLYLRLKYAGISEEMIAFEKDIKTAIVAMLEKKSDAYYVLTNYSPLTETRKILIKLGAQV